MLDMPATPPVPDRIAEVTAETKDVDFGDLGTMPMTRVRLSSGVVRFVPSHRAIKGDVIERLPKRFNYQLTAGSLVALPVY